MRPNTLWKIRNQPPLNDHSNQSVSALGLSQSVGNMNLTPSRSISSVSLETTEASGGVSEKENKRHKKNKKKATGDSKPNFTLKDYDNICSYIEEEENYDCLFGKRTKTDIGNQHMSYFQYISMN
ncbi:hypothetical protein O181_108548 [Austropuccinia psidii MF-1]|uniref:Uncharacterized protein n=1 Tax=Austropuccinia psidii MF-1 TaxID=1389203 RepID=A0A9Q3PNY6_9BASI|nr:hypothetical protein [Austropuccinia psidii MF-1]